SKLDRIIPYLEHDRSRRGRRFGSDCCNDAGNRNRAHLTTDQIGGQCRQSVVLALREAVLDRQVLALDIADFLEPLAKGHHTVISHSRLTAEPPDSRHGCLLCARRERPRSRAAEQSDEHAALHSITSSASNWIELGTSMPSALAVCMLITNS